MRRKNFSTARTGIKKRVIVTENGPAQRISKREVIAKHLVNKAAGATSGIPLLLNETRTRENKARGHGPNQVSIPRGPDCLENMIARIRSSSPRAPLTGGGQQNARKMVPEPRSGK